MLLHFHIRSYYVAVSRQQLVGLWALTGDLPANTARINSQESYILLVFIASHNASFLPFNIFGITDFVPNLCSIKGQLLLLYMAHFNLPVAWIRAKSILF